MALMVIFVERERLKWLPVHQVKKSIRAVVGYRATGRFKGVKD